MRCSCIVCSALSKITVHTVQSGSITVRWFFFYGKSAQFYYRMDLVLWKIYFICADYLILLYHSLIRCLSLSRPTTSQCLYICILLVAALIYSFIQSNIYIDLSHFKLKKKWEWGTTRSILGIVVSTSRAYTHNYRFEYRLASNDKINLPTKCYAKVHLIYVYF